MSEGIKKGERLKIECELIDVTLKWRCDRRDLARNEKITIGIIF